LFPFAVFLIGLLRVICLPWEFNLQVVGVQDIRIFPFAYLGGESVNNQCQGFVGAMGLIKSEWNDLRFDLLFSFFSSGAESSLASSVFGGDNLDVSLPKKKFSGSFLSMLLTHTGQNIFNIFIYKLMRCWQAISLDYILQ